MNNERTFGLEMVVTKNEDCLETTPILEFSCQTLEGFTKALISIVKNSEATHNNEFVVVENKNPIMLFKTVEGYMDKTMFFESEKEFLKSFGDLEEINKRMENRKRVNELLQELEELITDKLSELEEANKESESENENKEELSEEKRKALAIAKTIKKDLEHLQGENN